MDSSNTASNTATKIKHNNDQLCKFVHALGVKENLTVYNFKNTIYINIEFILPVLLVKQKWFKDNSESPTHYIIIDKNIYINKYGMTKLIGQSNQPASFKLQDYLYDLFYQVETKGYADKTIATYKEVNNNINGQIELLNAQISELRVDLALSEDEIKTLKHQNETLELMSHDVEYYKNIATTLAKYVRNKSKKHIPEAFDENLDIDVQEDSEPNVDDLLKDALNAKHKLKNKELKNKELKNKELKKKSIITPLKQSKKPKYYYIMRDIEESSIGTYQWHLTDIRPDIDHTNTSDDYLCGITTNFKYPFIHYRTLMLSNDKKDAIALFLSLDSYNNEVIENMFSIITDT